MNLVYNLLYILFRIIRGVFFREVEVVGLENVPLDGPVIIVGNHQNQFVDGVMLVTSAPRYVQFLIAAKSLKRQMVGFFARLLNCIPVTRPQDLATKGVGVLTGVEGDSIIDGVDTKFEEQIHTGDKIWIDGVATDADELPKVVQIISPTQIRVHPAHKANFSQCTFKIHKHVNQSQVFDNVCEGLKNDACIGIFPEGGSHDRSELLPLKAGVAIMALAAMEKIKASKDPFVRGKKVSIVPCGLNYFSGHRFRSHVLIEYGKPIVITEEMVDKYIQDKRETCNELLKTIETRLKGVTLNAPDLRILRAIIIGRRIYQPLNMEITPEQYLELNRRFLEGYVKYQAHPKIQHLFDKLYSYQTKLAYWGLHDSQVAVNIPPLASIDRFSLLLGRIVILCTLAAFALPAIVLNLPIGGLAKYLALRHAKQALASSNVKIQGRDVIATYKILVGMVVLPLLHIFYASVVGMYFGWFWAILTLFFFMPIYSYASVLLVETGTMLWRSTYPLLLSLAPGGETYNRDLQLMREDLKKDLREAVDELGPKIWEDKGGRIISKEDIEKESTRSPALIRQRSYVHHK